MTDISAFRHSLRTPLNHIIGYSEMLIEDSSSPELLEVRAELKAIQSAAHLLLQAIQRRLAPSGNCIVEDELRALQSEGAVLLGRIQEHSSRLAGKLDSAEDDIARIISATATLRDLLKAPALSPIPSTQDFAPGRIAKVCAARILVVDDDENNRDMLKRQVDRMGYAAETAPGGREALRLLRESNFDVMLLDIVMPDMDGFQVLTALKADPRFRDLAVIVISALDEMESVSRCIEMGADDFVSKPFDRVILQSRIGAVTKRRTAEQERSQLADRLAQLLESTGEGIFGIDREGRCTFINAAAVKMLGYLREDLLGHVIHNLVHNRRADGTDYPLEDCPMLLAAVEGRASRVVDEVFWRSTGDSFPVEYSSNPIFHEGELEGAVITFSDISDRKRTEEKFRETAKLESLGVLAGGVAHDFNNLLTGILGNASLVLYSPTLSESDRERLGYVIQASERAADLTKQMLAYAGKGRYEIRSVDLPSLVRETANLMQTMIPRTVSLDLQLDGSTVPAEGDPSQIQQIIMNLVINAGEAIGEPKSGTVTVRTFSQTLDARQAKEIGRGDLAPGTYAGIEVADTGSGMNPDVQARIFDPFYTTKFTGRGLGLAAVAGIVKSHRGSIRVDSAPGSGSRFRVYLPASSKPRAATLQPETGEDSTGSGRILVVDDEEIVRRTTQAVLEKSGYRPLLASGGEEAIAVLKENQGNIALVLLDMMMPGMSGDQAFRHLRAIRPDIPIIVSSGYSESQVMQYFSGNRVSAFIQKPYTSSKLIGKIGIVLDGLNLASRSETRT